MDFGSIFAFFGNFWGALSRALSAFWGVISNVAVTAWGVVLIVVGLVYTGMAAVGDWLGDAVNALAGMVLPSLDPSIPSSISPYLAFANTFFPLQETLVFLVAYLVLCLALQIYSLVKSWIPTVSGS